MGVWFHFLNDDNFVYPLNAVTHVCHKSCDLYLLAEHGMFA